MTDKTSVSFSFVLPTGSVARVLDAVTALKEAAEKHRAENISWNVGNYDFATTTGNDNGGKSELGRSGGSRDEADEDEGSAEKRSSRRGKSDDGDGGNDGDADDGKPARKRRGRPAKARTEAEGGDDADGAEDAPRNEPVGTRKGADEGADEGRSRSRGAGRSGSDQRGNRKAARVSTGDDRGEADDDWSADEAGGDEWEGEDDPRMVAARSRSKWPIDLLPCAEDEIDKTVLNTLLGDHFKATGGKDRSLTTEVMKEATGTKSLAEVDEADYLDLARALMKDAARYEFGIK